MLCSLGVSVSFVLLMFFHFGDDIYCKTVRTGTERVGLVAQSFVVFVVGCRSWALISVQV